MELLERVACLVSELKAVQGELELPEEGGTLASPKLPEPKVQELKAAVDRMRLFLWAYMDSRAASKSALEHTLQTLRIQRATEMLHSLRVHGARLPDNASARDLMAEIRALADMIASPGS